MDQSYMDCFESANYYFMSGGNFCPPVFSSVLSRFKALMLVTHSLLFTVMAVENRMLHIWSHNIIQWLTEKLHLLLPQHGILTFHNAHLTFKHETRFCS